MSAKKYRLEIKCFRCFRKVVRDSQKRTLRGNEFVAAEGDPRGMEAYGPPLDRSKVPTGVPTLCPESTNTRGFMIKQEAHLLL